MNICLERGLVDAHFEGRISPKDERSMRAHVTTCSRCSKHYERHLLLAELDPTALTPEDRIARGLGLDSPAPAASKLKLVATVFAIAAAIFLVLRFSGALVQKDTSEIASRGGLQTRSTIGVYRIAKTNEQLTTTMSREDELAFTYDNGADKTHLMIFGVDEGGRVYWFYPAWTSETDEPTAIPIEKGHGRHELLEAIKHRYQGSRLTVHGLFLDRAMTVREVESLLKKGSLDVPGAVDEVIILEIAP